MKKLYNKVKQWLKSKTINYGLALSIFGVLQVYVASLRSPFFTMIAGVIVVYLRFKTNEPVNDKKGLFK